MLGPLEALSVASAVIQMIDFGCKLLSQTQEIYHSANGATKDNVTSNEIAKDINILYKGLVKQGQSFKRSSSDDIALGKLVDLCQREAQALLELLEHLEIRNDATQWKSFKIALKTARRKGKVKELETRLLKLQKQIDSRLQLMMT